MLSSKYKFLFIHIPKTGGNSIQQILLPFSDDRMVLLQPHHNEIDRFEIRSDKLDIHKHSNLEDYRRQLHPDVFLRLFKFACVRNPWDRCVSFFFHHIVGRSHGHLLLLRDLSRKMYIRILRI